MNRSASAHQRRTVSARRAVMGAVVVDEAPAIAEAERLERLVDVAGAVGRVGRQGVLHRIVDALAGVLDVADVVPERAQAEQVHQRAPGDAAVGVAGDDAREHDLHASAFSTSSTDSGSSSDLPTDSRAHIRRYSSLDCRSSSCVPCAMRLTLVQDEDAVGVADGRQPVRDDEGGAARAQACAGPGTRPPRTARRAAEVGSSRIRIGASLSTARAIPSRCRSPPDSVAPGFGDRCVVAVRQSPDEVVHVRHPRRRRHLLVGRLEPAVADVVANRPGEKHGLLRHHRNPLAQRSQPVARHLHAVDQHAARGRLEEARDEAGDGRLAGAGQADERHHLARPGLEADAVAGSADWRRRRSGHPRTPRVPQCRTHRWRPRRRAPPERARASPGRGARSRAPAGARRSCARSQTAGHTPRPG